MKIFEKLLVNLIIQLIFWILVYLLSIDMGLQKVLGLFTINSFITTLILLGVYLITDDE